MCAKLKFRMGFCANNTEIICRTVILHTFKHINVRFFLLIKIWSRRERQNVLLVSLLSIWFTANWLILSCCQLSLETLSIGGWGVQIEITSLSMPSRSYWWSPDMKPFICSNWKMRAMVTVSSKNVKQKPWDYIPHLSRDNVDVSCVQVNFHEFRAPEILITSVAGPCKVTFAAEWGPQLRSACWCPSSNISWVWTILVK